MLYLPYAQNGAPLAVAVPGTHGWTDEQMERDVARFRAAGLDGLILGLLPTVFLDPLQTERVVRFLDLIEGRGTAGFSVVLMLIPTVSAAPSLAAESIGKWLTVHELQRRVCLRKQEGRVMLVCPADATPAGPPHPALYAVRVGTAGAVWTWGQPGDPARCMPTGPERQVVVYAGWRGDRAALDAKGNAQWELERQGGRTLEGEVRNAFAMQAGLICISSWNNYIDGDFVEPNSLDGDAVLRRLTALIRQAKEAGRASASRPAGGSPP